MKLTHAIWLYCTLAGSAWTLPAHAELPSFLRKENSAVSGGNQALQKGDAKGALEAYDKAARSLPDAPGVQLDRGLALLKQGEYAKAREALLLATVPTAAPEVRADAYHDLALSFYREADGLAGQDKHAEAQKLFRESVDAAKRSLHLRPSDANAAWNLELARRRVREEEQKQKEQEQQKKDEKKDQQDQKQDQNQDQKSDQQQDQKQDQDQNKPPEQDKDKNAQPKPDEQKQQEQADKGQQPQPDQKAQKPAEPEGDKDEPAEEPQLPREASQALDSLKDSEENFERYRARQRATRERRAPEKDW